MRTLIAILCGSILLIAICGCHQPRKASLAQENTPAKELTLHEGVQINPGAIVPVIIIRRDIFFAMHPGLAELFPAGWIIFGLTEDDGGTVWVIGDPDSETLTWRQAGTLAHEIAHVADIRYGGNIWAAMAAVSGGVLQLDCHGYGTKALLEHGIIPTGVDTLVPMEVSATQAIVK